MFIMMNHHDPKYYHEAKRRNICTLVLSIVLIIAGISLALIGFFVAREGTYYPFFIFFVILLVFKFIPKRIRAALNKYVFKKVHENDIEVPIMDGDELAKDDINEIVPIRTDHD